MTLKKHKYKQDLRGTLLMKSLRNFLNNLNHATFFDERDPLNRFSP